jgi:hypothetical protein
MNDLERKQRGHELLQEFRRRIKIKIRIRIRKMSKSRIRIKSRIQFRRLVSA